MHILKIIHGYPPNYNAGSEVYSQSIVNELAKTNKVTVFTREENDYEPDFKFRKETKDKIDFVYVNMARGKDGYNHKIVNKYFAELITETNPDVVHIGHLNHLSTGIVDVLASAKISMVYTLHDYWLMCPRGQFLQRNFDGENLYRLCDKQENNKCADSCYKMYFSDKQGEDYYTNWVNQRMKTAKSLTEKIKLFIAPSKYLMNRFINDFQLPKEKIIYLDYGFPTHYLQPVEPKTNGIFTFGYIGTHIPAKGLNILINAFKKIERLAKLKIFGRQNGQNTRALKKMTENRRNSIEFCGEYINQNLATTVFNKVNAIVVPSIWGENSPLVIHETQACKIPVITANFGGMKEYVKHNVNGLLFEHRNVESLYEQMKFAVDNPKNMKQLGQKGYLYSETGQVPDIQDHCKELIRFYNELK
ncbi:MAG: glycosyltransferase [Bacteroidales bacterium]|nr:glycosyltransferase [Bacteroidales bacterium]